tara:strand:+ start:457 stop:642 length:186 start_codon:yes stop_codon:yes gene_type:complete
MFSMSMISFEFLESRRTNLEIHIRVVTAACHGTFQLKKILKIKRFSINSTHSTNLKESMLY